jgi:hypothetical protein
MLIRFCAVTDVKAPSEAKTSCCKRMLITMFANGKLLDKPVKMVGGLIRPTGDCLETSSYSAAVMSAKGRCRGGGVP